MHETISEPDKYFFSDNYVSNETSFLQPADLLVSKAQKGTAYLGVGPEQNFTYIALTQPKLAFIVDIRRGNTLLHLLYKAIFEIADDRQAFVQLLLGRRPAIPPTTEEQPLSEVLSAATEGAPTADDFAAVHKQLIERITSDIGISLSAKDKTSLRTAHSAFHKQQLDIRFQLHEKNGRRYPSLRELMQTKAPTGSHGSFLASERMYVRVRDLQRENRVIPIVGDFAGNHAFVEIAKELRRRDLPVSVFYTSNVEQYILEPPKWKQYVKNIEALPKTEASMFLRCHLFQGGKKHPGQLKGHRTTTVLQLFDHFKWRQKRRGYGSFYQLATDGVVTK